MNLNSLICNTYSTLKTTNNLKLITPILQKYTTDDWKKFIYFDKNFYHKNPIVKSDLFDMYLICWNNFQSTHIHNHSNKSCIMKVLQNNINQKIYNNDLTFITSNILRQNDISYIDDSIGYHKINNLNHKAISLHIYTK